MFNLLRYLKPFAISVSVVLIMVLFQSLSELYLPTLMADIVDIGIVQGDTQFILRTGGIMLLFAGIGTGCAVLSGFLSARIATGLGRSLRTQVFSKVEMFSLYEMGQFGSATLITRTTNDITQVQQVAFMFLRMMVSAPMICIGGIVMAVSRDAELSKIFVVVIPVLIVSVALIASRGLPLFKTIQIKLDNLNLVLRENLTGMRVIRAFNRIDLERKRFYQANFDLTSTTTKVYRIMAAMMPTMMIIMNLTTISIIWFGGLRIDQGNMQVGDMMAFIQYAMQIMFSLIMVSMMFVIIPRASVSAARINEVLNTAPEIIDKSMGSSGQINSGYSEVNKGHNEHRKESQRIERIRFEKVTFHYPGAEKPALRDVSFQATVGETTAIIGGTGSGKSTLIKLLLRFYDVNQGSIQVDGSDIREISLKDLRKKVGYVPQTAVLFTGNVMENIRYGKKDASEEEIRAAAETAQAAEFIQKMDNHYDAVIAQGGLNLSGGQKQRLSIARALVRKPEIYVFDDSFSALDLKTDVQLRKALKKETKESTVIIVAQRISTVMHADQIIVLEQGQIAGIGRHSELLKTCEVYQEIVASQLSKEEWQ